VNRHRGFGRHFVMALATVALVAACSGSAATPAASSGGGITVTGAWVRNSTAMTGALAGYFVVANGGSAADTLLSASSPIAKTVQLHETKMVEASAAPSSGMGGMGSAMPSSGGMMTMVEVKSVDVPAGGSVEFKPGGYHVMFMDLTGTPATGSTIDLTLVFKNAGSITVKAEVRAQ
jgi:copper(I)-binding protein